MKIRIKEPKWRPTNELRYLVTRTFDALEVLTPEQRKALRRRLKKLNRTNCWWAEYRMRDGLLDLLDAVDENAKIEARRARKSARAATPRTGGEKGS